MRVLDRENVPCELIDGILVEKALGFLEALIATDLGSRISLAASSADIGVVSGARGPFKFSRNLIRSPDVGLVLWYQLPTRMFPREPAPELWPDLAIDVFRKGNTAKEMQRKLKEYFLAGTRLVWFVDPEARTVEVFTAPDVSTILDESQTLTGGDVLPGFELPLKQLFARVPKNGKRRAKVKSRKRR